ncbi:RICIN domain-containing protein [Hymenobacter koreensis]|uniref:Ricin B lectin domain-containing protein n=1 Tax=Hymenobacter koreensis TaxID=1084523 RepID=A0ABP8IWN5_9BACT
MKKNVLLGALAAFASLGFSHLANAQGAIVNGGTYKITRYGTVADGSAAAFGVPAGTPLCMDVDLDASTAGASIGQWGDNGINAQRFVFERQTDGSYKLRHLGTTMYVQTVGLAKVAGTQLEQNVLLNANDDAQRFLITDPGNNGRYKFTLKNSANAGGVSQVLEVGFASPAPGARIILWDDNGFEPAQRWELTRTVLATKNAADALVWLQAYPSPLAPGQSLNLKIEAKRRGEAKLEVVDMIGRSVHSQQVELQVGGNPFKLHHTPLAPGLYLVRLHQGDFVQQTQFVQQ